MKKLVFLLAFLIIGTYLLPSTSMAATDNETFISNAAIGGYALASTQSTTLSPPLTGVEREIAVKKQIAVLLNRIRQLRNMIEVMNTAPNQKFRDRNNDVTAEYYAEEKLAIEVDENEKLEPLGTVYTVELGGELGDAGKILITPSDSQFMLAFYDIGITQGTKSGLEGLTDVLPEGVKLTYEKNEMSLGGVTFSRESGEYNGTAFLGFITARTERSDKIITATIPFTSMSALEKELGVMSELTAIKFLYTIVLNTEWE